MYCIHIQYSFTTHSKLFTGKKCIVCKNGGKCPICTCSWHIHTYIVHSATALQGLAH